MHDLIRYHSQRRALIEERLPACERLAHRRLDALIDA